MNIGKTRNKMLWKVRVYTASKNQQYDIHFASNYEQDVKAWIREFNRHVKYPLKVVSMSPVGEVNII